MSTESNERPATCSMAPQHGLTAAIYLIFPPLGDAPDACCAATDVSSLGGGSKSSSVAWRNVRHPGGSLPMTHLPELDEDVLVEPPPTGLVALGGVSSSYAAQGVARSSLACS